ncbi:MAG: YlmC/YmxH family sporulation protein [Clostridia bacterium]|nr:YlmC/YmxH family sporulation protein [Clostridia bacterium]
MQGIDYTFCELREKVVVNCMDGKQLGRVVDIALHCSGRVVGLIASGDKKMFKGFSGNENIFIPWAKVNKIGDDVILVELGGVNSTEISK